MDQEETVLAKHVEKRCKCFEDLRDITEQASEIFSGFSIGLFDNRLTPYTLLLTL